jgi:hypothetical protein
LSSLDTTRRHQGSNDNFVSENSIFETQQLSTETDNTLRANNSESVPSIRIVIVVTTNWLSAK